MPWKFRARLCAPAFWSSLRHLGYTRMLWDVFGQADLQGSDARLCFPWQETTCCSNSSSWYASSTRKGCFLQSFDQRYHSVGLLISTLMTSLTSLYSLSKKKQIKQLAQQNKETMFSPKPFVGQWQTRQLWAPFKTIIRKQKMWGTKMSL